ncbi:MAG: hypothetical protein IT405_02160 [Candidatus Yanofskybacteria bacterium]|nr:hypothetical protein [Candidatus Yanofskybacteria bacterium]
MFVIRVVPLASLPATAPAVLDYFWNTPLPAGAVVRISWGHRSSSAVVLHSLDVRQAKLAVKSSDFALKRIDAILIEDQQATHGQLALAQWLATQYAASLATSLKTVLPPFFGKRGHRIALPVESEQKGDAPPGTFLLTQPDTALTELRAHIKHAKGPLVVIAPERSIAEHLAEALSDEHPLLMHSALSTKAHAAVYRAVASGDARVVIGTRGALFLPWTALAHIVVEDPLNEAYKSEAAPRYNTPDVARQLATLHGAALTWLSPAISTVHFHLRETGVLRIADRKPHWPTVTQVSMDREQLDGNRSFLSRAVQDAILDAYEQQRPLLLMSARKAYATAMRCVRCHAAPQCDTCHIPLRLHRTVEDMLVCYHCGTFVSVPKQCPSCTAGALKPAGIPGSQKIAEAVATLLDRHGYPKLVPPILDGDLVRSEANERAMLAQFDAMERPLMVASSMIFGHRYRRTFDTVIVSHLDALGFSPDFRTNERLVAQLERLADFMPSRMIIQHWHDESQLGDLSARSWEALYRDELTQRKMLRWPPYARIVKLTARHRDRRALGRLTAIGADRLKRAIEHIGARGTQILGPSPALVERARGQWTQHLILKSTLSGHRLTELLGYLPVGWTVDVDPRSIT